VPIGVGTSHRNTLLRRVPSKSDTPTNWVLLEYGPTAAIRYFDSLTVSRRDGGASNTGNTSKWPVSAYAVFHSVHWTRDAAYKTAFGEADFIVVNQSGEAVVIEQKSGALDETADGLIKRYFDGRKNVASQIHRTLDGIRDQFKRQSGHDIALDYLIYCPDYRLRDLNAVGLIASRIIDARDASRLADRIISILAPGVPTDHGKRVLRFFENRFHLVPDIHAHVTAGERAMIRLSGGLADTLSAIEMKPAASSPRNSGLWQVHGGESVREGCCRCKQTSSSCLFQSPACGAS
jgi:hypothetical protein